MNESKCRSCGASIYWATNPDTGKAMPVDADPKTGGQVILFKRKEALLFRVLKKNDKPDPPDRNLYTSHFATCANAASHRK